MFLNLNWIDWIIIAVSAYYVLEGWQTGLLHLVANLVSFLGSLWLAIRYQAVVGNFLVVKFGLPPLWTNVAGYLIVALAGEIALSGIFGLILNRIPQKILSSKTNQWFGAIVSLVNGLILVSFLLLLILALPLRGSIKQDVKDSKISNVLVRLAEKYGGNLTSSLDQVAAQAVKFLTVEPQSNERINLDISPKSSDLSPDPASEQIMVQLVNKERNKVGAGQLRIDESLITVARAHSQDMFIRHYFSHFDPDGHDASYRLEQAGIKYSVVGENLAYAPDVNSAHTGLMNSPGHKRNILDPEFHRVGIGIINGGIYGEMFTQLFAD